MKNSDSGCQERGTPRPAEAASNDPEVLRAALLRESAARMQAECTAKMQAHAVEHALDLLVREPDVEAFFGALTKTMVEGGRTHTCGVWLLDEGLQRCNLWMAYVQDHLVTPTMFAAKARAAEDAGTTLPCNAMADHLAA